MGGCCSTPKTAAVVPMKKPSSPLRTPAPSPQREPLAMGRFSQLAFGTNDPSKLIEGYEVEPLGSLEEALQPFQGRIQYLTEQIKQAKQNCNKNGYDGLTTDESAAIYLYSMSNDHNSVYYHLQNAWKTNDRTQMRSWFRYLRLFFSGVNKCPDVNGEAWQGIPYDELTQQQLNSGSSPIYTYMGSGSPSHEIIRQYLDEKYGAKKILIGYRDVDAKDITDYTFERKKEWLLHPGVKLSKNQLVVDSSNGSIIYHLTGKSSE